MTSKLRTLAQGKDEKVRKAAAGTTDAAEAAIACCGRLWTLLIKPSSSRDLLGGAVDSSVEAPSWDDEVDVDALIAGLPGTMKDLIDGVSAETISDRIGDDCRKVTRGR